MKKILIDYWVLTLFAACCIMCFLGVFVSPVIFWPAVFTSYAIPGILLINLLLLVLLPIYKKRLLVFPVIVLVSGLPFVFVTYSIGEINSAVNPDLTVMSLNAKLFRKSKKYNEFSSDMIDWAASDTSDIKCFQEYSTNSLWEALDVTKKIDDPGYQHFIYSAPLIGADHNPGLAIFSKYDILDSGFVWKNNFSSNGGIYIDIKKADDTVRVYNVHLESMNLELYRFKKPGDYWRKIKSLTTSLKQGAEVRSVQMDALIAHTKKCPYPFVICGDFNETPYSYNYFKLKNQYKNAFEEKGNGFGFSFNSILFFLRIDHQFFSEGIEVVDYRVDREMSISDHFSTRGQYVIE